MKRVLLAGAAFFAATTMVQAAGCPAVTVKDMKGVAAGKYPQQFELAEFQKAANCTLTFKANPEMEALNGKVRNNQKLPPLAERLPSEPLVVAPYHSVGKHGGTMNLLGNAPEAGTAGVMSIRHVNLVRYSDDLQTIVPNVAKGWKWNADYTQLTFFLRKGHKWSDGTPFTSADVKYWYDNLALNPDVIKKPKDYVLVSGKRMTVETPDPQTVIFKLPAPKPGLLSHFAFSYAQPYQPKHFLSKWDIKLNPKADEMAKKAGFKNGLDVLSAYYGNSDWMDTATPMLKSPDKVANLPANAAPTLESHIIVKETPDGRHYVANPYFFMVDTQGNQLPYISEQDETYANDTQVRTLKMVNGEVDIKAQSTQLEKAPILLENQKKGNYTIQLKPEIAAPTFTFNVTSANLEKRKVFGDLRFRQAMSLAINREEINKVAFFGMGKPQQYTGFSPLPAFVDKKWLSHMTKFDPAKAKSMLDAVGLKDKNGDGFRELPNGEKLVLNMQFSTQGTPSKVVELVAQHWSDVGIKTTMKEVTSDEYRSAQSANKLDVGMWKKGHPMALVLGNGSMFTPPFETYFNLRTGMLWAEYMDSKGAKGVKPPAFVMQMSKDIGAFQSAAPGSDESKKLASKLVENMVSNTLFIGTVLADGPIYHKNTVKNVPTYKTHSYEYYWNYPYRGPQWYLDQ